jgi:hypothetical protein
MLVNLGIALRGLGRHVEATEVSRAALQLPCDSSTPDHVLWLALEERIDGRPGAWATRLFTTSTADTKSARFLRELERALGLVQSASPDRRLEAFLKAKHSITAVAKAASPIVDDRGAVFATYRRVVRRLAQQRGDLRAWLWAWGRCIGALRWRPRR